MADYHVYEPKHGHGLAHDPLNAIVVPRPIGWISSLDGQGRRNLAPYSFFNLYTYKPPIVGFSSNGWKDSVANIAETKEFVWNLATRDLAEPMNATSAPLPHGADEFARAGLDAAPSLQVKPPRVALSPVAFECKLTQIIPLTNLAGEEVNSWLTLGEVVCIHIDKRLIVDGVYDTVAAKPIARGGGPADYFAVEESVRFQMRRPTA
ncbi:flavin reductase family protein [Dongia sp.]|uniref:flavin reductase family protein n=1 Tax=Dongia sp. TaxID=1977262 RepID=UPI003751D919